ncbi:MAG: ABC transporter permease subunit [Acidobacteriia bacterium]|nr:ABC transporter permease subunit [Terriglobia bacterium]
MIWVIALKEIRENILSLRFMLLLLLAVIFIPSSLYTNYRAYLTRLNDQQQIVKNNNDYLRKLRATQIFTTPNFTVDVYWPPSPASVFSAGFEETHPRHLVVGKSSVEYGAPLDVQSSSVLFGSMDYLFVVQFIFSLFAVLLSFDAITREKENGTLRTILANPLGRAALATGKLLGGYLTLAIPLILAFLVGVAVLAVAGLDVFGADFIARTGLILASSLLFIAVFFVLGLLVSSIVASTYAALVLSLAFWLAAVMVLPRTASQKVSAENSLELEKGRALQEAAEKSSVVDKDGKRVAGPNWQKERDQIAAPYEERTTRTIQGIEEDYRRRKAEQRRLGLWLARLSPAGAFASFTTEMAGTGIRAEDQFVAEADRYRVTLHQELFSRFYRDVYPNGSVSMGMNGPISTAQLPEFRLPRVAAGSSMQGSDLAILLLWFLLAAILTYTALARYDVR